MDIRDNIDDLKHTDDKFLKCAKPVANVFYSILGLVCLVFGIIGCVEISLIYLIVAILSPICCVVAWVFTRALLSLCHDVKILRNRFMIDAPDAKPQYSAPSPAPSKPSTVAATVSDDVRYCSQCGARHATGAKFCPGCGCKID